MRMIESHTLECLTVLPLIRQLSFFITTRSDYSERHERCIFCRASLYNFGVLLLFVQFSFRDYQKIPAAETTRMLQSISNQSQYSPLCFQNHTEVV